MNPPKYTAYTLKDLGKINQLEKLGDDERLAMQVVGQVLPFRVNNYVIEELIDWKNVPDDPMFRLTFPQRGMLMSHHFNEVANLLVRDARKDEIQQVVNRIRHQLNPHPAGQLEHNVPSLNGQRLSGMQHKYRETVLFFPSQGQICHAYCTFCFRWPQFVGLSELKFAMREGQLLADYLEVHPEVSDVLFTGGDPLVMKAKTFAMYVDTLLDRKLPNLKTIRIGTKALSYWPYKFITDPDADDLMRLFERITKSGIHLAIMAHINHPRELQTTAVEKAIKRILGTGAQIRTQAPLMQHINDSADVWSDMWRKQVSLGMIPYYMFLTRDTGAQHYFNVPLIRSWEIYRKAYSKVSGICRTVRGPSMSTDPGKIQLAGVAQVHGEKVMCLNFLQSRNPEWVHRPFFAEYDEDAVWLDQLKPAFGHEKFFFEYDQEPVMDSIDVLLSKTRTSQNMEIGNFVE